MQWNAYGGPYVGAVLALCLVCGWHALRRRRGTEQQAEEYLAAPRRVRFGAMLDCAGRSAMAAALFLLMLHLALSPWAMKSCDSQCLHKIQAARNPGESRAEFRAVVDQIRADEELMETFREEAKARVAEVPLQQESQ